MESGIVLADPILASWFCERATGPFGSAAAWSIGRVVQLVVGSIQIGILAHFSMDLGALAFVVQQNRTVSKMSGLDFPLSAAEELGKVRDLAAIMGAHLFEFFRFGGAESGEQDIVVERQVLSHGTGVALSAAATG